MFDDIYIDFSKACRIDKDEVLQMLHNDMDVLLECYNESIINDEVVLIPYYKCVLPRKKYAPNALYQDIISVITSKGISHLMYEIMPLIDSYIEYMATI
jgi:hypothetical protein